jgi:hypothetical protein
VSWATKGAIVIMGQESEVVTRLTAQGLDHSRTEFEGEFGGNKLTVVTVSGRRQGLAEVRRQHHGTEKDAIANQSAAPT